MKLYFNTFVWNIKTSQFDILNWVWAMLYLIKHLKICTAWWNSELAFLVLSELLSVSEDKVEY